VNGVQESLERTENYGEPAGVGRRVRSMVLRDNDNCCWSSIIFSSSAHWRVRAQAHWNLGTGWQTISANVVRAFCQACCHLRCLWVSCEIFVGDVSVCLAAGMVGSAAGAGVLAAGE